MGKDARGIALDNHNIARDHGKTMGNDGTAMGVDAMTIDASRASPAEIMELPLDRHTISTGDHGSPCHCLRIITKSHGVPTALPWSDQGLTWDDHISTWHCHGQP